MSVEVAVRYEGDLRCLATHGPSGETLLTDAPKDNEGEGRGFSPTDLVGVAMGTCMLTIMGIVARRHGIDLRGTVVRVVKEMATQPTRRIGRLVVEFDCPTPLTADQRTMLQRAALTCPVHRSLDPQVSIPMVFRFAGAAPVVLDETAHAADA